MDNERDDERRGEAASRPAPAAPVAGRHDALIERLFAEFFHGHPSMIHTPAFNQVRAFATELKKRLAAEEN
jgi:hypothetical protein